MSKLRIAIVGAGSGRGQSWMSTLTKLSQGDGPYEFCGLCEVVPDKRRESAARWAVPGYPTLLELLDGCGPDVLLNGAPPDSNVMSVGVAARRGVHVLTEIPVAPTCGLADLLTRTCAEHGVVFEVTEQVWLWAAEQLKRQIVAAGLIGEPQFARCYYCNKADYHGLNGARMLIGAEPVRVMGFTGGVRVAPFRHYVEPVRETDVWDHAVIEFDNGLTCLFESPPRGAMRPRWDLEGTAGQLLGNDLYLGGSGDSRHYPIITEYTQADGEQVLDHLRVDTDPPVVFANPHRRFGCADGDEVARMDLLLGFHRAVTEGAPVRYGAANARKDIELLFALRQSAERGNVWIDLPLAEPTGLERRIEAEFRRCYGDSEDPESLVGAAFPQGGTRYVCANWE